MLKGAMQAKPPLDLWLIVAASVYGFNAVFWIIWFTTYE